MDQNNTLPDDELSDADYERHMLLGGHAVQLTSLSDEKLKAMMGAIDARLDPEQTWDSEQKAAVLRESGYTAPEINDYFEELAPF